MAEPLQGVDVAGRRRAVERVLTSHARAHAEVERIAEKRARLADSFAGMRTTLDEPRAASAPNGDGMLKRMQKLEELDAALEDAELRELDALILHGNVVDAVWRRDAEAGMYLSFKYGHGDKAQRMNSMRAFGLTGRGAGDIRTRALDLAAEALDEIRNGKPKP